MARIEASGIRAGARAAGEVASGTRRLRLPGKVAAASLCGIAGVVLALLAFASGSALRGETPNPAAGDSRSLYLLFSINNVGFIDVCGCKHKQVRQGSVMRRSSFLKQVRGRGRDVALIDGGNTLYNDDDAKANEAARAQLREKAKVIVESYNRMGYQCMNVGHLDLLEGIDYLRELEKMARFPFISANFVDAATGKPIFAPTHEIVVSGVKIGIVGVLIHSLQPYYLELHAKGTKVLDPIAAAKEHVAALRARNDVVVALSYNDPAYNARFAAEVPGIDIVIDPCLDEFNAIRRKVEPHEDYLEASGVLIARTRPEGHSLGTIDLTLLPNGRPFVNRATTAAVPAGRSSFLYKREPIEPHVLEDPEIVKLVNTFKDGTKFVNTESLPPMPEKGKYLTAATCSTCHAAQAEFWKKTTHARAFATLEATNDQWRQDCIGCHTLGYGAAFIAPADAEPYKNVQCESCHGLNPEHPKDPASHEWPRISEKNCLVCHNENQTREEFHFGAARRLVACPKQPR
ncbi:MAG: hypothetical protein L0Z55_02710 [Planctomycetes bacterium]|nr:hypothetical protein [Planctomycetota bacterium]